MTDAIIQAIRSHNTSGIEPIISDLAYVVGRLRKWPPATPDQRARIAELVQQLNGILAEGELM